VKKGMGRGKGVRVFRFFSDVKISDFQFEIMKQRLNESISKLSTG
ncbi:transcriptional regulator, partial [Streptococcus pneumoniae]|nr:transcriptional regulator [Streptococcus pneumoniae]